METKREYCKYCRGEVTYKLMPDPRGGGAIPPDKWVWVDERGHIKEREPTLR